MPLLVTFGSETYKAGVELSTEEFWERMVAPDAPFPKTAAASPGDFKEAYEAAFAAGAEAIVSVHVAGTLSGAIKSAQIARDMLPDREIHVVDSNGRVDGPGDPRPDGRRARRRGTTRRRDRRAARGARQRHPHLRRARDPRIPQEGRPDQRDAQAAIGTLLSVKPIIKVKDGAVETVDKVRTRSQGARAADRAHHRAADRAAGDPAHDRAPTSRRSATEVLARAPGLDPADVTIDLVGASVGPHLGPGCVGAAVLYRA